MHQRSLKVCLLGASFRVGNGVAALAAGAIQSLLQEHHDAQVSLFDYAKESGEVHFEWRGETVPIRVVNIRFSRRLYLRNNIARLLATSLLLKFLPSAIRKRMIQRDPCLRHIDDVDIVASIAGGDSFSDIYGLVRFLYICLPQLLAIWMNKKLVLLPQTLGPFRSGFARTIARYILSKSTIVYSRDPEGLRSAARLLGVNGCDPKLRFCYDLAFALVPATPARVDMAGLSSDKTHGVCRVGLNVSGLLSMGGYNRHNMFGLRADYNELIRDIIQLIVEDKNATVLLVPHVIGSGSECDSFACDKLYAELKTRYSGRLGLICGDYDHREIKSIIGQCDFFIGSRMHACIAAVSQCVPTVPIAYSDKFAGVMETVGAELLVADPRRMDEEEILNMVGRAFDRRTIIREQLEVTIPAIRERVLGLFGEIVRADESPSVTGGVAAAATDPAI